MTKRQGILFIILKTVSAFTVRTEPAQDPAILVQPIGTHGVRCQECHWVMMWNTRADMLMLVVNMNYADLSWKASGLSRAGATTLFVRGLQRQHKFILDVSGCIFLCWEDPKVRQQTPTENLYFPIW